MPYIHLTKFWTPLELVRIQLFKCDEGKWYIKHAGKPLKSLKN